MDVQTAAILMLVVLGVFLFFHILVLARVIPSEIVWGGRIQERGRLVQMELVSIGALLFAAVVVALRLHSLTQEDPSVLAAVGIWVLVGLFALNTVGNLFAKTTFEKAVFTPVTLILTLLSLQLALG